MKITSFKQLLVWQKGHVLVIDIYKCTELFPSSEKFGLSNQLRRAAVSITSNIAEGFSRRSKNEKLQFYSIAHGSLTEVENQILIAKDVGFMNNKVYIQLDNKINEVHKMLNSLIQSTKLLNSN